ncbi:MAG: hypothetical protein NE327_18780 [Lentisphaeraceae bacterium]|nr:hypothetical protein [Lentisphaeraceae bacterium]
MTKRLYYGINISIFIALAFSILMTTNWFFQVHAVHQFQLKLQVLEIVYSWRFLFYGWPFEVLFNLLIGPACLFIWYSCRRKKFIYPYMIVIFLLVLLVFHCYEVTGFNVKFPLQDFRLTSKVYIDLIPLHFIPFYFHAMLLLFHQSKNKYQFIEIKEALKNLKYAPYFLILLVYVVVIVFLEKV